MVKVEAGKTTALPWSNGLDAATTSRKVIEDVRLSWDQLDTVRQRVSLLENAINIAIEVHESRIKRREAGQETLIDVLDAENEVFNAQIGAADAAYDARIAVYRLLFSLGRMTPGAMVQTAAGVP